MATFSPEERAIWFGGNGRVAGLSVQAVTATLNGQKKRKIVITLLKENFIN